MLVFRVMKKRFTSFVALFILQCLLALPIGAASLSDSPPGTAQEKSVRSQLEALKELAISHRDKPEEICYLKQLLDQATALNAKDFVYDALSNLSRYYYNRLQTDSLTYWAHQIDSLVLVNNDNPDAYYDVHSLISKNLFNEDYFELSIDEVVKMQNKAARTQHVYGQICSSEALGKIYLINGQDSLAITSFEEALSLLEKTNGDLYYRIYILSNQIQSVLKLEDLSDTETYLKKYDSYISQWETVRPNGQSPTTTNLHRWLLYSFYTDYYIKTNQIQKAKEYLDKSVAYGQKINYKGVINLAVAYCSLMQATYYNLVGQYPQALAVVDSIIPQLPQSEFVRKKIEILSNMGHYKEAAVLYKEHLQDTDLKYKQFFARQVEQLRTLQNINDQEEQQKELNISAIKVKQNKKKLFLSLTVMALLSIAVYTLAVYLRRSRRLKNALENEKSLLIQSQQDLLQAKLKVDRASRMKSTFIANISHEIRTPLNAIVGFSSLVVDPHCDEEERKEYASVINNNSDLLLNIVNDVLDLSRMETESLAFSLKPTEIGRRVKEALASVQNRVDESVKLTYSFPRKSFELTTDPLRIQQLLLNLLTNAIKFTKEGEINLAIDVDDSKQEVRFIVTDTGCGIPADKHEKIFERFEKLDNYVQGAGLGLPICRMIAEYLGGSLIIDPTYTTGARFIFTHPFHVSVPTQQS